MLASIDVNGLSVFAEAGLVVFLAVFVAVTVRAIRTPAREASACSRLPLEEDGEASRASRDREVSRE